MNISNHKAFLKIFPQETIPGCELINESEWAFLSQSSRRLINSYKGFSKSDQAVFMNEEVMPNEAAGLVQVTLLNGVEPRAISESPNFRSSAHSSTLHHRPMLGAVDLFGQCL